MLKVKYLSGFPFHTKSNDKDKPGDRHYYTTRLQK
uniref:Uncharacterized protein n=1 Tax=Anguilla anguilla TaxID=7936 RepID=A0A0E9RNZ7_ANGAN